MESELLLTWALKFKADSKEIVATRGNDIENFTDEGWPSTTTMKVLGMHVGSDGATCTSINETLATVLKLGWKSAAQADRAAVPWRKRLKLLRPMAERFLDSRWHMWSPSKSLGLRLDRLQSKLWATAAGLARRQDEPWLSWVRREPRHR